MSKPQWLIEQETKPKPYVAEPCWKCRYFKGKYIKAARHKGGEKVDVYACKKHPACLNTMYSICCDDFEAREV